MEISILNIIILLLSNTRVFCKINDPAKEVAERKLVEELSHRNLGEVFQLKLWWEKGTKDKH